MAKKKSRGQLIRMEGMGRDLSVLDTSTRRKLKGEIKRFEHHVKMQESRSSFNPMKYYHRYKTKKSGKQISKLGDRPGIHTFRVRPDNITVYGHKFKAHRRKK